MGKEKKPARREGTKNLMNPEEFRDESAHLNTLIIENATEGIYVCHNITGYPYVRFTVWNNRMEHITGYTMDEINKSGWYQTVYPDPELQDKAIERMERMREGDNLKSELWEITRKGGEKRTVTISTSLIRTDQGSTHVLALMNDFTDQKKILESLEKNEKKYRQIVENATDIIFTTDIKGKYQLVNLAGQRTTRYTLEELQERTYLDLILPEYRNRVKFHYMRQYLRKTPSTYIEYPFRNKTGDIVWFGQNASLIEEQNIVRGFHLVARDITERKNTEEELKKQFQFLETLLNTIPNPVFYKDLEGKYLGCNNAFADFIGRKKEEIIGKTVYDMGPKEIAEKYFEKDKELFRNPGIQTYEWKVTERNGEIRHVVFNKGTFNDARGNIAGLVGIISDISERKKAYEQTLVRQHAMLNLSEDLMIEIEERERIEGQLRESEEKYRMLFEAESDAIMVLDGETRKFVHVNNAAVTLYGYPFEEFLNMRLQDISAEPEESEKTFRSTLSGEIVKVPLRYHRKKDGTVFSVEISAGTFIMKEKQMVISAVRDISERTKAEEILRQYQARLSALASQIALIDEEERRRFANELHDFTGQNLALAKIMLSELESTVYDREIQGRLKELRQLIEKSVESTRSLTFELSPPILYELGFEAAADWLGEQLLKRYNIMFHFQDDSQPKPLPDNTKVLLYLSLRELIVNIAKHAKAGNATLSIRRQDNDIQVTIADDGIGFDASDMDYQIMKASSFGLFSTRERLERLGGKLKIASKPGKGTTVTMVAPLKE